MEGYGAVILAGGAGRRMGGSDKPARPVAGRPMLLRVLDAVSDARVRIVVGAATGIRPVDVPSPTAPTPTAPSHGTPPPSGPPAGGEGRGSAEEGPTTMDPVVGGPRNRWLPAGVVTTVEDPPGGGPAAATATGVLLVAPDISAVVLLAADLPLITGAAVRRLLTTLDGAPTADGVVYVDGDDRAQWLCGAWRLGALRGRIDDLGGQLSGAPLRALLAPLTAVRIPADPTAPPPFFDCDTDADLRLAEEWIG